MRSFRKTTAVSMWTAPSASTTLMSNYIGGSVLSVLPVENRFWCTTTATTGPTAPFIALTVNWNTSPRHARTVAARGVCVTGRLSLSSRWCAKGSAPSFSTYSNIKELNLLKHDCFRVTL